MAQVSEDQMKPIMLRVELLKHYRPTSMAFNVIKEAPAPVSGVASDYKDKDGGIVGKKLWAGTIVDLPATEARKLLFNEVVTMEARLDENGKPVRDRDNNIVRDRKTVTKFPLAVRADPLPDERAA